MAIKYTDIFHCKILPNLPKPGYLAWKYAIWQPWCQRRFFDQRTGRVLKMAMQPKQTSWSRFWKPESTICSAWI
jgi:hypothetical protein